MLSLLEQEDSLIKELLKKMKITNGFEETLKNKINMMPKMSGGARPNDSIYVSRDVDVTLNDAEKIATKMKDEYVSVEHIMLSLFDNANGQIKDLFRTYGLTSLEFIFVIILAFSVIPFDMIRKIIIKKKKLHNHV